jgi:predicted lipase
MTDADRATGMNNAWTQGDANGDSLYGKTSDGRRVDLNASNRPGLYDGYASGMRDIQMEAAQQRANRERMFQDSINNLDKNWQFKSLANPWGPDNAGLQQSKMNVQGQTGGQLQNALLDTRRNLAQRGMYADSGLAQNQDLQTRLAAAKQNSQMMGTLDAENYTRAGNFDERQNDLFNKFNEAKTKARYAADQDQLNNLQEEMRYYQGLQQTLPDRAMDLQRKGTDLASYQRLLPYQEAAQRSNFQYKPQVNDMNLRQYRRDDELAGDEFGFMKQNQPLLNQMRQNDMYQNLSQQYMRPVQAIEDRVFQQLGRAGQMIGMVGGFTGGGGMAGGSAPPMPSAPTNLGTYGMVRPNTYRGGITPYASDYGY